LCTDREVVAVGTYACALDILLFAIACRALGIPPVEGSARGGRSLGSTSRAPDFSARQPPLPRNGL